MPVCVHETQNPASDICVPVFKPQTSAWFELQGQTSITPPVTPHLFQPNASIFSAISLLTPHLTRAHTHQQSTGLSGLIPKGWTSNLQTLITHCRMHHLVSAAVSLVSQCFSSGHWYHPCISDDSLLSSCRTVYIALMVTVCCFHPFCCLSYYSLPPPPPPPT